MARVTVVPVTAFQGLQALAAHELREMLQEMGAPPEVVQREVPLMLERLAPGHRRVAADMAELDRRSPEEL